jgi:hypothetical protein
MNDKYSILVSHEIQNAIRDRRNALRSKIADISSAEKSGVNVDEAVAILRAKLDELDFMSEKFFKIILKIYNDSKKQ